MTLHHRSTSDEYLDLDRIAMNQDVLDVGHMACAMLGASKLVLSKLLQRAMCVLRVESTTLE